MIRQTLLALAAAVSVAHAAPETEAQRDARMAWFRDAHFGMFIHWGLYAKAAGEWNGKITKVNNCAEWLMLAGKVPRADYSAMAKDFNPTQYDADAWVRAAKEAGMRYIVITSKHHEGFAMFKTAASPYNIVDATPFKRDPLKDLSAACKKYGIKLGFYYSQNLDWYHPGGGGGDWDPTHKGDPEEYVNKIVIPQLREILTNYGEISVLWFDIPNGVINKSRADRIYQTVMDCNPRIIINNRLGGGYQGDIETPEQHIPPMGFPGKDWEACMTMNRTWGFAKDDHNWKSPETLIRNLADITSKGGNYLLNVGPDDLGRIPEPSLERLAAMGEWMKVNHEAIYGVRAGCFPTLPAWGRVTTRVNADGTSDLYAIVFDAPKNGALHFPGLTNKVLETRILGSSEKGTTASTDDSVTVTLPASSLTQKNFVVALKLKGAPAVSTAAHAEADGKILLAPLRAVATNGLRVNEAGSSGLGEISELHLGFWTNPSATASWNVKTKSAGKYQVSARIAAPQASAGSVIELVNGSQVLPFAIKPTGDWKKFDTLAAEGELQLPAGESTITVRVKNREGEAPCNLGVITLTPAS